MTTFRVATISTGLLLLILTLFALTDLWQKDTPESAAITTSESSTSLEVKKWLVPEEATRIPGPFSCGGRVFVHESIGVRCLHSETVTYEVLGESCFHRPAYPVYVLEQPNGASITIDAGRVIGEYRGGCCVPCQVVWQAYGRAGGSF